MNGTPGVLPRHAEKLVREALEDTPVVLVHGPRQAGKTTLVRAIDVADYATLDDGLALDAAVRSPESFLAAHPGRLVLDEVQRAPQLFRAIKAEVDRRRTPGRYLLTGSANAMLLPRLSDSLAGRIEVITLWPLSQGEIERQGEGFVGAAFSDSSIDPGEPLEPAELRNRMLTGGFPEPQSRKSEPRRRAWFDSYLTALVERDVRDLAQVDALTTFPRLLRLIAARVPETLNVSSLSRESGIAHTTLTRYLSLLEAVFLLVPVPAWTVGRSTKSPKLAFVDTGLLVNLLAAGPERLAAEPALERRLLENFAAMEMRRQLDAGAERAKLMHFRSVRQFSVSHVLEHADGRIVGIEVVTGQRACAEDFRGLEFLREVAGERFHRGFVLHTGAVAEPYTDRLGSLPVSALWRGQAKSG